MSDFGDIEWHDLESPYLITFPSIPLELHDQLDGSNFLIYGPLVPLHKEKLSNRGKKNDKSSSSLTDTSESHNEYNQYLPTILIYEKFSTISNSIKRDHQQNQQQPKLIFQYIIDDLPRLYQKSLTNAKMIEIEFNYFDKNDNKQNEKSSNRIKGKLKFSLFWSSVPKMTTAIDDNNKIRSTTINEHKKSSKKITEKKLYFYELIIDQEKRHIKMMSNLNVINQTLHDLRYLSVINWSNIGNIDYNNVEVQESVTMRKIHLMDLLLRQKYQFELDSVLKNNNTINNKKRKQKISEESRNKESTIISIDHEHNQQRILSYGVFCADEYIEQNKRFQLLIYRNNNYHKQPQLLNFIPLNNITDVMIQQIMLNEKSEQLSMELLLNYIRKSTEDQMIRLRGSRNVHDKRRTMKKKKKNVTNRNEVNEIDVDDCKLTKIFHDWCLSTAKFTSEKMKSIEIMPNSNSVSNRNQCLLIYNSKHWIQTIGQVLEKLDKLDHQQKQELINSSNVNEENSINPGEFNGGQRRIVTLSDIVKEDQLIDDAFGYMFVFI